jgi:predicted dehydrogenase
MKKINIAILGAGFISQVAHIFNYNESNQVSIVAIIEKKDDIRNLVQTKYNIKNSYKDHEDFISNNKDTIDLVVIVVRRNHNYFLSKFFLKNNYNIFCEKPMALTKKHAHNLQMLSKKNNLFYAVGFMRRYDPIIKKAREIIKSGSHNLGKIKYINCAVYAGNDFCGIDGYFKSKEPYYKKDLDNWKKIIKKTIKYKKIKAYENFLNKCSHQISLLNFFFNEKPKIKNIIFEDLDRYISFTLKYKNFFCNFYFVDYYEKNIEYFDLFYEKGIIKIDMPPSFLKNVSSTLTIHDFTTEVKKSIVDNNNKWCFKEQVNEIIKSVISKNQPLANGEDSYRDFEIINEVWNNDK